MSIAMADAPPESRLTRNIPIESIHTDGKNGSARTSGPEFDEFVNDVRQHGVLQAVLVRAMGPKSSAGVDWHLIAGHRRLAAAKKLGQLEIPAVVSTLPAEHDEELRLVENLHRQNLHPLEEAEGYERLLKNKGATVASVAGQVGRSPRYIHDRVRFTMLTPDARRLFREGRIETGHAVILARLTPENQKLALDPDPGRSRSALFVFEAPLFDPLRDVEGAGDGLDGKDPWAGFKARTPNELQAWVDDHVRLEAGEVDPMLFPVTADEVANAVKVLPITRSHALADSARGKDRTFGPQSWRRADGKRGSKPCEASVIGMVVAGYGRGEAFAVCAAKDRCSVHWASEMKEKAKREKERASSSPKKRAAAATKDRAQEHDYKLEERVREISEPLIEQAVIEKSAEIPLKKMVAWTLRHVDRKLLGVPPTLKGQEQVTAWLIKQDERVLVQSLALDELDSDWGNGFKTRLGIDWKSIKAEARKQAIAERAPKPAKAAAASGSAAKKANATKPAKPPRGQRPRTRGAKKASAKKATRKK